jgi:hypothetical protein
MVVQIDLNGSISGTADKILGFSNDYVIDNIQFFNAPDDFNFDKYNYTPIVSGVFNPNGFTLKPIVEEVNPNKRQENIDRMNAYMKDLVTLGQLSQANFELFISDTLLLAQSYLLESGRLFTFIETVSRNGYNASTTGFKTKTAYRGNTTNGVNGALGNYPRANDILAILNDL